MLAKAIGLCAPIILGVSLVASTASAQTAAADLPPAIAAPGETPIASFHAEGAQIYVCQADKDGKLAWAFREPIAALIRDGKTVGRHYAGPTWEYADGSAVVAKVAGKAAGARAKDIAWLKLEVTSHRGNGLFADASTVQRIDTHGGDLQGPCAQAGAFQSVPYSATYVVLRKAK